MWLKYNTTMGIRVDDENLPDPSAWNYTVSDLDTEGGRDATGYLHRAYVATKINYEFSWEGVEWEMLQLILGAINKDKFTLTAPDPRTFNSMYTGDYYVGDRTGKAHYYYGVGDNRLISNPKGEAGSSYGGGTTHPEIAVYSLKLKFIEY